MQIRYIALSELDLKTKFSIVDLAQRSFVHSMRENEWKPQTETHIHMSAVCFCNVCNRYIAPTAAAPTAKWVIDVIHKTDITQIDSTLCHCFE